MSSKNKHNKDYLLLVGDFKLQKSAGKEIFFANKAYHQELLGWLGQSAENFLFAPYDAVNGKANGFRLSNVKGRFINRKWLRKPLLKWLFIPIFLFVFTKQLRKATILVFQMPNFWSFWMLLLFPFFRKKKVIAIYEANWSWGARETWANRFQQWVVKYPKLLPNWKVLTYGQWPDAPYHVYPYFKPLSTSALNKLANFKNPGHTNRSFLWVGDFSDESHWQLALAFFYKWQQHRPVDQMKLIGIGNTKNCRKALDLLGLTSNVALIESENDRKYYQFLMDCHYLLYTPKTVIWPTIVMEAMLAGCIPVVTRVGVLPEIIGFGNRGVPVRYSANDIFSQVQHHESIEGHFFNKSQFVSSWAKDLNAERFSILLTELIFDITFLKSSEVAIYR